MNPTPSSFPTSGPETSILAICPLCNATDQPLVASVLAARDDHHLLYLECRRCGTTAMALVTAGPVGLSTIGVMTDLTPPEVMTSGSWGAVTDDDVIDFTRQVRQNDQVVKFLERWR